MDIGLIYWEGNIRYYVYFVGVLLFVIWKIFM